MEISRRRRLMGFEYIIEGKIFVNGSFQSCCFGVEDESITAVKKVLTAAPIKRFPKQVILPTGIDMHVHFRDPGFPEKETFRTGTTAAAYGGISTVFDMPNTLPHTITKNSIYEKINNANKQSLVDFGVYAGVTDDNIAMLPGFAQFVSGYKVFLSETTNAFLFSLKNLSLLFESIKKTNKPVLFHAEDRKCLANHKRDEKTPYDHHISRPCLCEQQAISMIFSHIRPSSKIHICHVSCNESIQLILDQKQRISFGITPHHCLLHAEPKVNANRYPLYKVNPPLRNAEEQKQLFNRLKKGEIPIIESDHAPHTKKEKSQDFSLVPSGIIGVETMYPLFLYLASKQIISFPQTVSMISESPSLLLNLKKGFIKPGYHADFMTLDLKKPKTIRSDHLHSKQTMTPFEGHFGHFPNNVYIRGEPVIEDGSLVAKPGDGRHVLSSPGS